MTQATQGFATPAPATGSFSPSEHDGDVCVILVHKLNTARPTQFGHLNTVDVSVFVVAGPHAGQEYIGTELIGRQMVPQLMGLVGQHTLGKIGRGPAKAGKNAPMILIEPTAEERAIGEQWWNANQPKIEQARVVGMQMAQAPKQAPQPQQQPMPQQSANGFYAPPPGYGHPQSAPPAYGQQPYGQPMPMPPAEVQQYNQSHPVHNAVPGAMPPPPPVTQPAGDQPPF